MRSSPKETAAGADVTAADFAFPAKAGSSSATDDGVGDVHRMDAAAEASIFWSSLICACSAAICRCLTSMSESAAAAAVDFAIPVAVAGVRLIAFECGRGG